MSTTTVDEQLEILKQRDSNIFALNGAGMTLCATSSVMMAATPPWFVRDDDLSESEDTRRGTSLHEYPGGTQRFSDTSSHDECQVSMRRKTIPSSMVHAIVVDLFPTDCGF